MALMEQWLSMIPALSALPVPLWAAGIGVMLVLTLLISVLWLVGIRRLLRFSFTYGLFIALLAAAYFGFREYEDINQRKLLEERANAVFSQTIQPDTVFACIDGSPAPAMQDACERAVFAEPQRVAQAVAITNARVSYLIDATRFAQSRDRSYAARVVPLRKMLEADPYGLVGFVLASSYQCLPDLCDKFSVFNDPERVQENIRSRRYEAYMAKYAGVWRGEPLPEEKRPESDVVLPGVAVGDKPKNLIPLETGPPAKFDAVPRGNPIPSGPLMVPHTTPPAAATPPSVTPPPTVGGPVRPRAGTSTSPFHNDNSRAASTPPESTSTVTPASAPATPLVRPIMVDPEEKKKAAPAPKPEAKSEPKAEPKSEAKGEDKSGAQKKSATASTKGGEPKGNIYQRRGNEPVGGLPRLVPGDYKRPDPNDPPDTPTPSGVIMPN